MCANVVAYMNTRSSIEPRPIHGGLAPNRTARVLVHPLDRDVFDRWLDPAERSEHTVRGYRRVALEAYGLIGKTLPEWTLADLHFYLDLVRRDRSRGTYELARDTLRSLCRHAYMAGRMTTNPANRLKALKSRAAHTLRILSRTEIANMRGAAHTQRDRTLIRFLYISGARVHEAASLRWNAVRPHADGGATFTVTTKKGEHEHYIPEATYRELLALPRVAMLDAPVFASLRRRGVTLSVWAIHGIVARSAKRAAIVRAVSPHFLRRSHVMHARENGAGPNDSSRFLE